jgi:hypothetical protein
MLTTVPDYQPPIGTAVPNTPPAPNPPQSPSGSVTGESAAFNFAETVTSTQNFLQNNLQLESGQQGVPAQTVQPQIAGVDPKAIAWNNATAGNGTPGNKFS